MLSELMSLFFLYAWSFKDKSGVNQSSIVLVFDVAEYCWYEWENLVQQKPNKAKANHVSISLQAALSSYLLECHWSCEKRQLMNCILKFNLCAKVFFNPLSHYLLLTHWSLLRQCAVHCSICSVVSIFLSCAGVHRLHGPALSLSLSLQEHQGRVELLLRLPTIQPHLPRGGEPCALWRGWQ